MAYEYDPNATPRNGALPFRIPLPGVSQPVGFGDVIARLTGALGIRPCDACKRRQQWLNQRLVLGGRR